MKSILIFIVFSFLTFTLQGQGVDQLGIPCNYNNGDFEPLKSCQNYDLEIELAQKIKANKKWKSLVAQKRLAISLVDMSNLEEIEFAQINGDEMMYAASLPKIAILLAAMDAIEKCELQETPEVLQDMDLMIAKSNNQASTRMIDRLGYNKIATVLTDPKYKFYDENNGGGLWVGKRYAAGGKCNREPLEGLSHAATSRQVARFYYMMAYGKLVSEERSEQMMGIMDNPKLHHKFVNTYDKVAPEAALFRKSGSYGIFHSDSIMVWGPDRQYILVALVEDADGENIIREIAKVVDSMLQK